MGVKKKQSKSRDGEEVQGSLSALRDDKEVLAILAADLHIDHQKPACRSEEPDWYEAQARPVRQLKKLWHQLACPILVAGDVLHRYNPPPELLNWYIKEMPQIVAVPGNHELPNHRYEDIERSGYWTLVKAGKIVNLKPGEPFTGIGKVPITVHGFPFGVPVTPIKPHDLGIEIALVHQYVWNGAKTGHEGAEENQKAERFINGCVGYDVIVTGDNHIPFNCEFSSHHIHRISRLFNPGCLIRRRLDEKHHRPSVGLLYEDGSVERYYLDCSKDKFTEADNNSPTFEGLDVSEFISEMDKLVDKGLNFLDIVKRTTEKLREPVKTIILEALEGGVKS